MNRLVVLILLLAATACARRRERVEIPGTPGVGDYTFSFRFEARQRSHVLHVPPGLQRSSNPPLLLAFHGDGGNAEGFQEYAGLHEVSDRERFLVAYPDGTGPLRGRLLTWNAGACCGWAMQNGVHSVDDPRALYDGGLGPPFPGTSSRVNHRPVMAGLAQWIEANRCAAEPVMTERRSGRPGAPDASHTASRLVWSPCAGGAEIVHWRLTGAGHGWPGGHGSGAPESLIGPSTTVVNAAEEVWAFVSRFSTR